MLLNKEFCVEFGHRKPAQLDNIITGNRLTLFQAAGIEMGDDTVGRLALAPVVDAGRAKVGQVVYNDRTALLR